MVKKRTLTPLPAFDQEALPAFLREHGFKEAQALSIWRHLAAHPTHSFAQVTPQLSKRLVALLEERFAVFTTTRVTEQRARDGTVKLLLRLQDGHEVEAVIMRHTGRNTLCVSSQVGCQMGCTFCATGTMGIIADLCSGEILEQLAHANAVAPIRNVVFMGMGEPLNNYNAVLAAIRAMTSVFGLAPKHITLSTVGVIHRIRQLTKVRACSTCRCVCEITDNGWECRTPRSCASRSRCTRRRRRCGRRSCRRPRRTRSTSSCRRSTSTSRSSALSVRTAADIIGSLTLLCVRREGRLVMVEYCMLEGVNDSIETAHILGKLLQGRSVHVNLIPYNTTEVGAQFRSPSPEAIREFHSVLRESYTLKATIRENHGTDIDGACGQLALKNKAENGEHKDIEDIGTKRAAKKATSPQKKKQQQQQAAEVDAESAPEAATAPSKGYLGALNDFVDRHQQTIGFALLGASVAVLALGYARRARAHA